MRISDWSSDVGSSDLRGEKFRNAPVAVASARPWPDIRAARCWGVAKRLRQRTLTPSSLVRIQPPQPNLFLADYRIRGRDTGPGFEPPASGCRGSSLTGKPANLDPAGSGVSPDPVRAEGRRAGKECVGRCRS